MPFSPGVKVLARVSPSKVRFLLVYMILVKISWRTIIHCSLVFKGNKWFLVSLEATQRINGYSGLVDSANARLTLTMYIYICIYLKPEDMPFSNSQLYCSENSICNVELQSYISIPIRNVFAYFNKSVNTFFCNDIQRNWSKKLAFTNPFMEPQCKQKCSQTPIIRSNHSS